MPLFLITSVMDEGVYERNFQVVEAPSKVAIAQHMLNYPSRWGSYLNNAFPRDWRDLSFNVGALRECTDKPDMTAERFLELIEMTDVDGDSGSQLRIFEVTTTPLANVNA